jgi:hypothetical protein
MPTICSPTVPTINTLSVPLCQYTTLC